MKPKDYIGQYGTGYFNSNKGKGFPIRLHGDDELVLKGSYLGISRVGDHLPLIDGLLIEEPQYSKNPDDGRLLAVNISLLLVDDMEDIVFE